MCSSSQTIAEGLPVWVVLLFNALNEHQVPPTLALETLRRTGGVFLHFCLCITFGYFFVGAARVSF